MTGKAFDMRPLRKDSKTGVGANLTYLDTANYDQELTREFIHLALGLFPGMIIRFNDGELQKIPEFRGKVLKDSNSGKTHNDHLHLEFP